MADSSARMNRSMIADIKKAEPAVDFFESFLEDSLDLLLGIEEDERSIDRPLLKWKKVRRAFACRFSFDRDQTQKLMRVLEELGFLTIEKHGIRLHEGIDYSG